MENFYKNCPECNCIMPYSRKDSLVDSIKKNRQCRKCSKKGTIPSFIVNGKLLTEIKEKTSNTWFKRGQRPVTADTRKGKTFEELYGEEKAKLYKEKISAYERTEESNDKRRKSCKKAGCGLSNKNKVMSIDAKLKISTKLRGRKFTEEHIKKLRLSRIDYINKCIEMNGGEKINPRFNIDACHIFDNISKRDNINIQHALNGGEYYISELGYWVDGYDVENNTVYEYDEKGHFLITGELRDKDITRQNNIKKYLKCNFIRIKLSDII